MITIHITTSITRMIFMALLFYTIVKRASGIASTTTTYADSYCMEELAITYTFGTFPWVDGDINLGNFNTCYDVYGAGSLTVCDVNTGVYGTIIYTDELCVTEVTDLSAEPSCIAIQSCSGGVSGGVCSTRTTCSSAEPSVLVANIFNFVATEYTDVNCRNPTGKTEIVSTSISGVGDGKCTRLGTNNFRTSCNDDGRVSSQYFGSDDNSCSGEVYSDSESLGDPSSRCDPFEMDGLYYNALSCTTDASTLGETSSPTPSPVSPTPSPVSPTPEPISPTPEPISPTPEPISPTPEPVSGGGDDDDDTVESDPSSNIIVIVATTVGVSFLLFMIGGCVFMMCKPCRKECGKKMSGVPEADIEEAKTDESVIECVVGVPTAPSDSMAKGIICNDIPEAVLVAVPI